MKKNVSLLILIFIASFSFSQRNYALKDLSKQESAKIYTLLDFDNTVSNQISPSFTHHSVARSHPLQNSRVLTSKAIGTSANIYTCLVDMVRWLTYNPELNIITFVHRLGGPWGGTSSQLRVKYSSNFFTTKDSVQYIQPAPGLCRYPSNILYNPAGNTNPLNAFSIVCGPSTNGTGWVNNYFGSQNLGGTNLDFQVMPTAVDTIKFLTNGFSGGSGKYHAAADVKSTVAADASKTRYFQMYNATFNSSTNKFDWTNNYIHTLFKMRAFANATATYNSHENVVFEDNGLNGYFYAIGKDSFDNPGTVAMPIVWKTIDGGTSWTKEIYQHFATIPALQAYIWPTLKSLHDFPADSTQWIFRPNISAGSSVDEGNSPGTIDKFGNLHIAAIVEGLYSIHPDSLSYGYNTQPSFLFDLIRTDTGWNAVFIDTINTNFVNKDSSGFGSSPDNLGWGHWIRMSKNADGSKVFVTWTDTDPTIDQSNIMPEVHSWGLDVDSKLMTASTLFETNNGNIFYMMAADKVAQVGSTYKIPITYVDIYESGPNSISPQKHYFLNGVQFDESNFNIPTSIVSIVAINVSPSSSICQGQSATLTAPSGVYYSWNTGATTQLISVSTPGTYSVTVIDNIGDTIIPNSVSITVSSYPVASAGSDVTICQGSTSTLTASGGTTYLWSSGQNIATAVVSPTFTTTYTVTVSNSAGCSSTDQVVVNVNSAPVANAGIDQSICIGQSAVLTASGGINYIWSSGASTATTIVTPTSNTTYTVTVVGSNGCTATDLVLVSLKTLPVANAGTDQSICNGTSANLTAIGGVSYIWSSGANTASTTVTPTTSTTYTVTVTGSNGCTATDQMMVNINPVPLANAGSDQSICLGQNAVIQATGGISYQWSSGAATATTVVTPTSSTTYIATVYNSFNCNATDDVTITVNPLPTPQISGNANVCEGDITTYLTPNISGNTYLWNITGGSPSTANSNSVDITWTTSGQITLIETNSATSCVASTSAFSVAVNPLPAIPVVTQNGTLLLSSTASTFQWYFENVPISGASNQFYAPVNDGQYQVEVMNTYGCSAMSNPFYYISIGISYNNISEKIQIFPNPAHDLINVKNLNSRIVIEVYDISEKKLIIRKAAGHNEKIDMSSFSKGIYFLRIIQDGKLIKTEKVILL